MNAIFGQVLLNYMPRMGSMHRNRANTGSTMGHRAYEIFALYGLRRDSLATSAPCGTRADLALPPHAVAAGGLQLPSPADLFGLWRRGDRALWAVGRRMDDPGAAVALPALGHFGDRQRAADQTAGRAMVSAVALWAVARGQRALAFVSSSL